MRINLILVLCFLLFGFSFTAYSEEDSSSSESSEAVDKQTKKYSLQQIFDYILLHNGQIKEANLNVESKKLQKLDIWDRRFKGLGFTTVFAPKPNLAGTGDSEGEIMDSFTGDDVEVDWGQWGLYNDFKTSLEIPIYTFGKFEAMEEALKRDIEIQKLTAATVKLAVIKNIYDLYYKYQMVNTIYLDILVPADEIVKDALDTIKSSLDNFEDTYSRNDLEKIRSSNKEIEDYLFENEMQFDKVNAIVRLALNLNEDQVFAPENDFLKPVPFDDKGFEYYKAIFFSKNVLWKKLIKGIEAKEKLWDYEKAFWAPDIFAFFEYSHKFETLFIGDEDPINRYEPDVKVAVGLRWVFSPIPTYKKQKQAEIEYLKLIEKKRYSELESVAYLKDTYWKVLEKKRALEGKRKQMEDADNTLKNESMLVYSGVADIGKLTQALKDFYEKKKNYYQAIYDYNMAVVELSITIGEDVLGYQY